MKTPKARPLTRLLRTPVVQSQTSTVFRGTAFEERTRMVLQTHLSMSLRRVGGKEDGGIDLVGWWWLPAFDDLDLTAPRRRLRVLVQCKAEKKKLGPNYVREMEGVLHRYILASPLNSTQDPTVSSPSTALSHSATGPSQHPPVALLVSESPFTKSTLLRVQSSPVPFFLLHLPPISTSSGIPDTGVDANHPWVGTAVWNPALGGSRGLLGGGMETRWERSSQGIGRPGLWWRNRKLKSWTPEQGSTDLDDLDFVT